MVSAVEFKSALTRWTAKRLPEFSKAMQVETAVDLGSRIIRKMPVRTGLARGNVRLGIGERVALQATKRRDLDGAATLAALQASAERLAPYSKFTIYDNLPYIPRLEDGWSKQAPLGMFRVSVKETVANESEINRKVRLRIKGQFIVR